MTAAVGSMFPLLLFTCLTTSLTSTLLEAQATSILTHKLIKRSSDENTKGGASLKNCLPASEKIAIGPNLFQFNKTNEVAAMTMAGERNENIIMVSMVPGFHIGPIELRLDNKPSTLHVSTDYGLTFEIETLKDFMCNDDGLQPSTVDKNRIILVGYTHDGSGKGVTSTLWISTKAGTKGTWIRSLIPFRLDGKIVFHPLNGTLLLAYSATDFSVWLSQDFGVKWIMLKKNIRQHSFHWGTNGTTIYLAQDENVGVYGIAPDCDVLKTVDLGKTYRTVLKHVHSFGLQGRFIYASVIKDGDTSKRILKVSTTEAKSWHHAELPDITPDRFYSILDMNEGLVFMHVDSPGSAAHGTLYTSGKEGIRFSESLERHLFTPNSLTDFYRVRSIRGVYLASQVNTDDTITTMITYNRGATWQRLPLPSGLQNPCQGPKKCSLQLHISYSISVSVPSLQGPLSQNFPNALIMAHGHVGDSLQTRGIKVFISSDGGHSWRFTGLDGFHFYKILDYGGLIVAVKTQGNSDSNVISFSTDEGRCWLNRNFTTNGGMTVKGLQAAPDGHSMVVNIWGMMKETKHWAVITVDFKKTVTKTCIKTDYVSWVEHGGGNKNDECLLGEKMTNQRLKPNSFCHNNLTLLTRKSVTCPCQKNDYECEYGYERNSDNECVRSKHLKNPFFSEPKLCIDEKVYVVQKHKYRMIPGDKCDKTGLGAFVPKTRGLKMVKPEIKCTPGEKVGLLVAPVATTSAPRTPAQNTALAAIIITSVLLFSLMTLFFVRKFIILGKENGSYRYSRVQVHDDDEFEALLPNSNTTVPGGQDYLAGNDDDDDFDFDLDMELERGLAGLHNDHYAELAATDPKQPIGVVPPELSVSASQSPVTARKPTNIRSYLSESDDDLIA